MSKIDHRVFMRKIVGEELWAKSTRGTDRFMYFAHKYKGSVWACVVTVWPDEIIVSRQGSKARNVNPDSIFMLGDPDLCEKVRAKLVSMLHTDLVEKDDG